jgi:hypothetical protein
MRRMAIALAGAAALVVGELDLDHYLESAAALCKAGAREVQSPMPRALTPHGPPAAS